MTFTNEHTELEIFAEENPPKRVNRPEACGLRHLAFCVESVEQTVNELAEVGIECEPIRVDDYTDKKMTFFHDPDGLPNVAVKPLAFINEWVGSLSGKSSSVENKIIVIRQFLEFLKHTGESVAMPSIPSLR